MWLAVYQDQYTLMGTPTVMSAKIIWDVAFYWGFIGLLYMNDRFVSVADDPGFVPHLDGLIALSNRVQRFFREWAAVESGTLRRAIRRLVFAAELHGDAAHRDDGNEPELRRAVRRQRPAAAPAWQVSWSRPFSQRNRRCSVTTTSCRQVQAWQRDSLLRRAAIGLPPGTAGGPDQRGLDRRHLHRPCSPVESTSRNRRCRGT